MIPRFWQEMMGWHDPKITLTMTCCELCTSHNIVNTGPPTAGASSAACKYNLRSSCTPRFAPGGLSWPLHPFPLRIPFMQNTAKMKGICGGNGSSGRDRHPGANWGLQLLRKWYLQAAYEAPAVRRPVSAMLWGVQSSQQVIVMVILGCCHPIISCSM